VLGICLGVPLPVKHCWDHPTYKRTFERLRPFSWLLYELDRVPKSFYVRFCQRRPLVDRSR
jgi:hypothetical protein